MSRAPSEESALAFMRRVLVDCHLDLAQEWHGWKIRGRCIVTPDGDRVSHVRLQYLIQSEALRDASRRRCAPRKDNVVSFRARGG